MKRLLSLDDGRISGIFSPKTLSEMERKFRTTTSNPGYFLADHHQYFGEICTGAITTSPMKLASPPAMDSLWTNYKSSPSSINSAQNMLEGTSRSTTSDSSIPLCQPPFS